MSLSSQESHTASARPQADSESTEITPVEEARHQRWRRTEITLALDSSLDALPPEARESIKSSFVAWEDTGAALPTVRFTETEGAVASLKPDGQSTVIFAPIEFEGHESDLAITIGFSNPNTGEISEADIVINSKHTFSQVDRRETALSGALTSVDLSPDDHESCTGTLDATACGESYDLTNVLTHEVGHFFGLGENYDDPQATMFSCTSACEIHKRNLEPADVDSIILLYVETDDLNHVAGCSGVQFAQGQLPGQAGYWAGWVALLAFGLWRRCRRLV